MHCHPSHKPLDHHYLLLVGVVLNVPDYFYLTRIHATKLIMKLYFSLEIRPFCNKIRNIFAVILHGIEMCEFNSQKLELNYWTFEKHIHECFVNN